MKTGSKFTESVRYSKDQDAACIEFLQWSFQKLRYRWKGFRRVRRQVCRRIQRRISELKLSGFHSYRDYLESREDEWNVLDSFCHISISRFYRDRAVFEALQYDILPQLALANIKRRNSVPQCWCSGCCSGEEPYTVNILWKLCVLPNLEFELPLNILATERHTYLLKRARQALYSKSSVKDMPSEIIHQAFDENNGSFLLKNKFKLDVDFKQQDVRYEIPSGLFDIVFCRNLVFTYFQLELQMEIFKHIVDILKPGGFLIIGTHESLPDGQKALVHYKRGISIYQKVVPQIR